jgi:hypothetical protein
MTYWPISAPSVYAASKHELPLDSLTTSDDGVKDRTEHPSPRSTGRGAVDDEGTPRSESTEASANYFNSGGQRHLRTGVVERRASPSPRRPQKECVPEGDLSGEILGIRVTRSGHMFATITRSTLTIWQTKVR